MKFMLFCYDDPEYWENAGHAVHRQAMEEAVQLTHRMHAKGQYILASPLQPVSTATSVRIRDGKRIVTDGPFAETHEVLGGFFIVDVKDMNEALELAAQHPGARVGCVEVRPILEIPGLPENK